MSHLNSVWCLDSFKHRLVTCVIQTASGVNSHFNSVW